MDEGWFAIEKAAARSVLEEGIKPLCDRISELEANNLKLSDELDLARDCLRRGDARDAEYAQLKAENDWLRRLLSNGPSSAQECAKFCRAARTDGDGKPCIDCNLSTSGALNMER